MHRARQRETELATRLMKNRLRVLRTERHWSQQELANRVGVSRQTINAVETGRFDPSLPLALKLARTFESPVESVFELEHGE
jgi:putative transcriptional regulator